MGGLDPSLATRYAFKSEITANKDHRGSRQMQNARRTPPNNGTLWRIACDNDIAVQILKRLKADGETAPAAKMFSSFAMGFSHFSKKF
ncbi:hypothetical protein EQM14_10870 [Caproiciproducens sp. NJN-50]|uniref:hypothetical protein n=1 Tax=Acutalibacteraceae TaxID=3082771 RepID=UPI000FFDFBC8|nr:MULTISPECIES: hypothetical protein [Acutalibacteraceae]QAT50227.1 hypothetical protein EQM14_10870 [Caproiciproducens sp. NJN-50]